MSTQLVCPKPEEKPENVFQVEKVLLSKKFVPRSISFDAYSPKVSTISARVDLSFWLICVGILQARPDPSGQA